PANEIDVPASRKHATAKELDLALGLIKRMTGHFDPAQHPDDYREAVLAAASRKEEHEELAEDVTTEAKGGKVIDLAELLSRSLGSSGKRRGAKKPPVKAKPVKRAAHPRATKKSNHRKAARR
ncbi:MAG: hypothetical protein ACXWUG_12455, partial [Polyangiales bacterium]